MPATVQSTVYRVTCDCPGCAGCLRTNTAWLKDAGLADTTTADFLRRAAAINPCTRFRVYEPGDPNDLKGWFADGVLVSADTGEPKDVEAAVYLCPQCGAPKESS